MHEFEGEYPIALMARCLGVSRSGYYAWVNAAGRRQRAREEREAFDAHVKRVFDANHGVYGSPRICLVLAREGIACDRKTVAASMVRQGLYAHPARVYRTRKARHSRHGCVAPDRCERQWDTGQINQVWVTDFTQITTSEGPLHLVAVTDAHSRRILGIAMGPAPNTTLALRAIRQACQTRFNRVHGVIVHTDRGPQFTSYMFNQTCRDLGLVVSMGETGVCWDNAMAESVWAVLKRELITQLAPTTRDETVHIITMWIEYFYNRARLHSALGNQSPIQYEQALTRATPNPQPETVQT